MSTYNIHFLDKIGKQILNCPLIFVFLSCPKNFLGTQKRVRISYGKRGSAFESLRIFFFLYFVYFSSWCHWNAMF